MKRSIISTMAFAPALLLAALLVPAGAAAAGPITTASSCTSTGPGTVTCDLWAKPGTLALPGTAVTAWGYSTTPGGSPSFPGPTIVVTQGDTVIVHLTNNLTQPTSLVFNGVAGPPDLTAVAPAVAPGDFHTYTFTASTPGTYLYEAGILPGSEYQVSMGLHGALIVRPQGAANRAYADASTAFADEALVIVSEIDPALNNNANPQGFDLRNFAPKYFLVNGKAYSNAAPTIPVTAGNSLLLRYANAGILNHSMGVLGLHQRVLAADGSELPAQRTMVAETIAPGQSADVLVTLPATTAASTLYPVYDAAMVLNNSSVNGMGGMLAFLDATPGTGGGGDTVGPATSGVTLTMPAGDLSASVDDASTGGSQVAAAEYFIDTVGASGTGTSMTGTPTPPAAGPVAFAATIPAATLTGLSNGMHTVYVHGQDSAGNWGASATVLIDKAGPTTIALTLTPNPSNGTVSVALAGTASDATSGGGNVTAAEYFLGATGTAGSGTALTLSPAATVSLTGSIPAQATSTTVSVHARDAAGNWGPFATINLSVDNAGPVTSGLTLTPSAANGQAIAIAAAASDTTTGSSNITAGEYFIDSPGGADGSGTALGVGAASPSTTLSGTIPAAAVAALSAGSHTVSVHARDAAGNWGARVTATLLVDRTLPTLTSIGLAAINPTLGGGITMTLNGAADPAPNASGVAGGEYWLDAATRPAAGGTAFTGTGPVTIPAGSLTTGSHTVYARIRDAAGNWSTPTRNASVSITAVAIFSNGFETGARPWGWTSASTTSTSRLDVTTVTVLAGAQSLQARGDAGNYVQYNFGTTANPASGTYDARFLFRPNGNASTGQDIFVMASNTNYNNANTLARVRYRVNGTTPQVQLQVGSTANPAWVNLLAGTNVIEVVYQSANTVVAPSTAPGTFKIYLNGAATAAQSLTVTSNASVSTVRLGSVTSGGGTTPLEYFDSLASKRSVSPLFGP